MIDSGDNLSSAATSSASCFPLCRLEKALIHQWPLYTLSFEGVGLLRKFSGKGSLVLSRRVVEDSGILLCAPAVGRFFSQTST